MHGIGIDTLFSYSSIVKKSIYKLFFISFVSHLGKSILFFLIKGKIYILQSTKECTGENMFFTHLDTNLTWILIVTVKLTQVLLK